MATENKILTDATFLNHLGSVVRVADVVTEKECWYVAKEKRWVLAHRAIQKIAALAGVSKNYAVEESPTIQPNYKNELEHIVRVTIKCVSKPAKGKKGCRHDEFDNTLTVTGEANKLNTPVRGRGYLRKMAEKRAFDIAVLEHVGLYDTTFSEEESETMLGKDVGSQSVEISNADLEALKEEINMLVECDTEAKLANVVKLIAGRKTNYKEAQQKFLNHLVKDRELSIKGIPEEEERPF